MIDEWPEFNKHKNYIPPYEVENNNLRSEPFYGGNLIEMDSEQYNKARKCVLVHEKLVCLCEEILNDNAFDPDIHQSTHREYINRLNELKKYE